MRKLIRQADKECACLPVGRADDKECACLPVGRAERLAPVRLLGRIIHPRGAPGISSSPDPSKLLRASPY